MTDNKSPELSGKRDDLPPVSGREPVLTGHNAKVLADRRGAYLAGNLEALIDMMSEEQCLRFKQWNVRIVIHKALSVLPLFEKKYPDDQRPRQAIAAAQLWLDYPTEENRAAARSAWWVVWSVAGIRFDMSKAWNAARAIAKGALVAGETRGWDWVVHGVADVAVLVTRIDAMHATRAAVTRAQLRAAYIILQRG